MARKPSKKDIDAQNATPSGVCVSPTCALPLFGSPPYCPFCGVAQPTVVEEIEPDTPDAPPPVETPKEPEKAAETPKPPSPPAPQPSLIVERPKTPPPTAATAAPMAKPPTPVAPVVKKKKGGCGPWVFGAIGLLLLLSVMRGCGGSPPGTETLYVTRPVNIRSEASKYNTEVATLERGVVLTGQWVMGSDNQTKWLKISKGPYNGNFAWGKNLSARPRPELTLLTGRDQRAQSGSVINAEPDPTSKEIGSISIGETVTTVGVTGDGWTEIAMTQGGVGYTSSQVFESTPSDFPPPN